MHEPHIGDTVSKNQPPRQFNVVVKLWVETTHAVDQALQPDVIKT
jgi:hypothetical protein